MLIEAPVLWVVVGALVVFCTGLLFGGSWAWSRARRTRKRKADSARATIRGQVAEQLAPMLPDFDYANADARFLGAPVDYVVFDGLSSADEDVEVVFVEVKTGKARLSARERRVKDAVKAGRVRYETLRLELDR